MKKHIKKYKSFFGYFAAAGSGVVVQYIVGQFICIRFLGTSFETGVSIGYWASVPVGFVLSKNWAFSSKNSGKTPREAIKFFVVLIFSFLITVIGSKIILTILQSLFGKGETTIPILNYRFNPLGTISHFSGMGMSFIFNFFAHKWFTFNETGILKKVKSLNKK